MLENKVGMIFGVANKRSIAWACAEACLAQVSQRQEVFGQGGLSQFPSSPRAVAGRGLRGQRLRE